MSDVENIRIQRIFSRLNFAKLVADDQYFLDYFLNYFVSYVGWQEPKHEVLQKGGKLSDQLNGELIYAGKHSLSEITRQYLVLHISTLSKLPIAKIEVAGLLERFYMMFWLVEYIGDK